MKRKMRDCGGQYVPIRGITIADFGLTGRRRGKAKGEGEKGEGGKGGKGEGAKGQEPGTSSVER